MYNYDSGKIVNKIGGKKFVTKQVIIMFVCVMLLLVNEIF